MLAVLLASTVALLLDGGHGIGAPSAAVGEPLRILYASDWGWPGHIYAVDPSGKSPLGQVTVVSGPLSLDRCARLRQDRSQPAHCRFVSPRPSPDGRRLLFAAAASDCFGTATSNQKALFVARADGTGVRRVAETRGCLSRFGAVWSPDSRRLAYSGSIGTHVADADGSHDEVVGGYSPTIAWAPDSRSLAFLSAGNLVVSRAGVGRTVARGIRLGTFAWAPRGGWLAYARDDGIEIVRPDGKARRRVTNRTGHELAWSHDGGLLAFDAGDTVQVADIRTGDARSLATDGSLLAWSPRRRQLAYDDRKTGIRIYDPTTGADRLLTPEHATELAWSPAGSSLAYVAAVDFGLTNRGDLKVVTLDGNIRTLVAAAGDHGGDLSAIAWTRPARGTRYRTARGRTIATVSPGRLVSRWPIGRLAADGARVAFTTCNHVFVWRSGTGELVQAEPTASLTPLCGVGGNLGVHSLAIGGARVAYGQSAGGNGRRAWLVAVNTGADVRAATLASTTWTLGCIAFKDAGIGELVGSGDLLAFGTWTEDCSPVNRLHKTQEIRRVEPDGRSTAIVASVGALVPLDADGGRIVAGGTNATWIVDRDGRLLRAIPVSPRAAQLAGDDLVIAVDRELQHYDARDGGLLHRWPLPDVATGRECGSASPGSTWGCAAARLVLEDVADGHAAYVLDGLVHLLRLATGADVIVAAGTAARFTDAGLVVAEGPHLRVFAR